MKILEGIEQILYDILGFFIPGLVFMMLLNYYLPLNAIIKEGLKTIQASSLELKSVASVLTFIIVYLLGHIIRFLSVFCYNILFRMKKLSLKSYSGNMKTMKALVEKRVSAFFETPTPEWDSVYNLASTIIEKKNIKSIFFKSIAKYNLYRSLAFTFAVFFFVSLILLVRGIAPIQNLIILATDLLFCLAFHFEFMRHWTLCGDEAILALFYHFNVDSATMSQGTVL